MAGITTTPVTPFTATQFATAFNAGGSNGSIVAFAAGATGTIDIGSSQLESTGPVGIDGTLISSSGVTIAASGGGSLGGQGSPTTLDIKEAANFTITAPITLPDLIIDGPAGGGSYTLAGNLTLTNLVVNGVTSTDFLTLSGINSIADTTITGGGDVFANYNSISGNVSIAAGTSLFLMGTGAGAIFNANVTGTGTGAALVVDGGSSITFASSATVNMTGGADVIVLGGSSLDISAISPGSNFSSNIALFPTGLVNTSAGATIVASAAELSGHTINAFEAGDVLDLRDVAYSSNSVTYSGGTLSATVGGVAQTITLTGSEFGFSGSSVSGASLILSDDLHGGTFVKVGDLRLSVPFGTGFQGTGDVGGTQFSPNFLLIDTEAGSTIDTATVTYSGTSSLFLDAQSIAGTVSNLTSSSVTFTGTAAQVNTDLQSLNLSNGTGSIAISVTNNHSPAHTVSGTMHATVSGASSPPPPPPPPPISSEIFFAGDLGTGNGQTSIIAGNGTDTLHLSGGGTFFIDDVTISGIAKITHDTADKATLVFNMFGLNPGATDQLGGVDDGDSDLTTLTGSGSDLLILNGQGKYLDLASLHATGFEEVVLQTSNGADTLAASAALAASIHEWAGDSTDILSFSNSTLYDLSGVTHFQMGTIDFSGNSTLKTNATVIAGTTSFSSSANGVLELDGFGTSNPGGPTIFDLTNKAMSGITGIVHVGSQSILEFNAGELASASGLATLTGGGADILELSASQTADMTGLGAGFSGFSGILLQSGDTLTITQAQMAGITSVSTLGNGLDQLNISLSGSADLSTLTNLHVGLVQFQNSNFSTVTLSGAALSGVGTIAGATSAATIHYVIDETAIPFAILPTLQTATPNGITVAVNGVGTLQTSMSNLAGGLLSSITGGGGGSTLSLTGAGSVTLSGAAGSGVHVAGFSNLKLVGGENVAVDTGGSTAGLPSGITQIMSTGISTIDASGSLVGNTATIDLTGVSAVGPVVITPNASLASATTQNFTISDPSLALNLFPSVGVTNASVTMTGPHVFTGHQALELLQHGFSSVFDSLDGVGSTGYTMGGVVSGISQLLHNGGPQGIGLVNISSGTFGTMTTLPTGMTQLFLTATSSTGFDMHADTISASGQLVLWGSSIDLTLTLPDAAVGTQPIVYVSDRGNDIIHGGAAPVSIFGGAGNDHITLGGGGGVVQLDTGMSTVVGGTKDGTTFTTGTTPDNVQIFGGIGGGDFTAGGNFSVVVGGGGTETLSGGFGLTEVNGQQLLVGAKNDVTAHDLFQGNSSGVATATLYIEAGVGTTSVTGGAEQDVVVGSSGNLTVSAMVTGGGALTVEGAASTTTPAPLTIVNALGASSATVFDTYDEHNTGLQGALSVVGGSGALFVYGTASNTGGMIVNGGQGTALIVANGGSDHLSLGSGGGTIYGGAGADTLSAIGGTTTSASVLIGGVADGAPANKPADIFVVQKSVGAATIQIEGFRAGTSGITDQLDLTSFGIFSLTQLESLATIQGGQTVPGEEDTALVFDLQASQTGSIHFELIGVGALQANNIVTSFS